QRARRLSTRRRGRLAKIVDALCPPREGKGPHQPFAILPVRRFSILASLWQFGRDAQGLALRHRRLSHVSGQNIPLSLRHGGSSRVGGAARTAFAVLFCRSRQVAIFKLSCAICILSPRVKPPSGIGSALGMTAPATSRCSPASSLTSLRLSSAPGATAS